MYRNTVLAVDDDVPFCNLLKYSLEREGYQVLTANTTEEAETLVKSEPVDLMLLDVRIPGSGGINFCRKLRTSPHRSDLPVLMMSVLCSEDDRVRGLDAGADDYLCKPFPHSILLAHVRAILRRSGQMEAVVRAGDIKVDFESRRVLIGTDETRFSPREFDILCAFIKHPGKLLTRHAIAEMVWGTDEPGTQDRIDKYVRLLRLKLGPCAHYVQTVWGLGYRFVPKTTS